MRFKKAELVPNKTCKNLYEVKFQGSYSSNTFVRKVTAADEIEVARFIRQHRNAETVLSIVLVEANVLA